MAYFNGKKIVLNGKIISEGSQMQAKAATPTAAQQTITADSGYDGLSSVTINGDNDLTAANIKKDVAIFGVTGTYEQIATVQSIPQTKSTDIIIYNSDYYLWRA